MKKGATLLLSVILIFSLIIPINSFAEDAPPAEMPAADAQPGEEQPPETPEENPEAPPAEEPTEVAPPLLTAVNFEGAELVGEFSSDVFEYNLQVTEHSDVVKLASYKRSDYNAQVKVYYLTNSSGDASGLVVRLENSGGLNEYKFFFDTIKEVKKTPDASLLSLAFDYGELSPKFSADVFKYTLYLPKDLEVLNINAVPSDENAKVNTPSQIKIGTDRNFSLSVKITSSDGTNTADYKLNVKRVDKTIAQIKAEMDSPDFESFVEIPFYQTAPFYIGVGVAIFLIALALVLFFALRKKKPAASVSVTDEDFALPAAEAQDQAAEEQQKLPAGEEKAGEEKKAEAATSKPEEKAGINAPVPKAQKPAARQPQKPEPKEQDAMLEQAETPQAIDIPNSNSTDKETVSTGAQPIENEPAPEESKPKKKARNGIFGKRKKQKSITETSINAENETAEATSKPVQAQTAAPKAKQAAKDNKQARAEDKPVIKAPADPEKAFDKNTLSPDENSQKTAESEKNAPLATDDWLDLDKYKKYK